MFVTWTNEDQSAAVAQYISGVRLYAASGSPITAPTVVASGAEDRFESERAYNRTRNGYLVVYTLMNGSQGDIWAVCMDAGGTILGGGEFAVAAWSLGEEDSKVAASPTANTWLVVWHSLTENGDKDVYGRFVNGDGTIDGAPAHFSNYTIGRCPSVTCLGESSRFFVAWSQQCSNPTGPIGVWRQAIDADHSLDALVAPSIPYSGEVPDCARVAVTGGGSSWLVVWDAARAIGGYKDIRGRNVYGPFNDGFENRSVALWTSWVS